MTSEDKVKVTVRLFAAPREFLGRSEIEVVLPSGTKLSELIGKLSADYPGLAKYLPYSKLAVNHAISQRDAILSEGDVVALLPPVGGG